MRTDHRWPDEPILHTQFRMKTKFDKDVKCNNLKIILKYIKWNCAIIIGFRQNVFQEIVFSKLNNSDGTFRESVVCNSGFCLPFFVKPYFDWYKNVSSYTISISPVQTFTARIHHAASTDSNHRHFTRITNVKNLYFLKQIFPWMLLTILTLFIIFTSLQLLSLISSSSFTISILLVALFSDYQDLCWVTFV